ncbi:MAG: orotidine 5'-phosphate decarboxylase, partial [Planctomycetaceae bacterium]|nr:orotidine 5'-phosphate decarboxylase [Planctomycetaceae bacterium]
TFQDRQTEGVPVYRAVAEIVETFSAQHARASEFGPVGAVVGATYPEELAELRSAMPHVPLLVPGYGSQGAGAGDVMAAFTPDGLGAVVNNSRGINFAHERSPFKEQFGPDQWEEAVAAATRQMISDLAQALAESGKQSFQDE